MTPELLQTALDHSADQAAEITRYRFDFHEAKEELAAVTRERDRLRSTLAAKEAELFVVGLSETILATKLADAKQQLKKLAKPKKAKRKPG